MPIKAVPGEVTRALGSLKNTHAKKFELTLLIRNWIIQMRFVFLTLLSIGTAAYASEAYPSHCSNDEKIVFNCKIRNSSKILSLCASRDLSDTSGHLQYRFGSSDKVELEFPKERKRSQKKFLYQHYYRYQVDRTEISFVNHGHKYKIFSYYEGDGPGAPIQEEGVRVDNADFNCSETVTADFALLEDAVPCYKESALGC